jgi:hypothetical protein
MEATTTTKTAVDRPETSTMLASARRTLLLYLLGGAVLFVAGVSIAIAEGKSADGSAGNIPAYMIGGGLGALLLVAPLLHHINSVSRRLLQRTDWEVWHCTVKGRLLRLSREDGGAPELAVKFSPWFGRRNSVPAARRNGVVWLARVAGEQQVVIAQPGPKAPALGSLVSL